MASLTDGAELVGFFSYSREDDEDSNGALSALRDRIQRELRGQLGRTSKTFRLWQDREAIAPGKLWEQEIKLAVAQAVFFIPIITPSVVRSDFCRFELDAFLSREAELGRDDLVFPILYIRVAELDDAQRRMNDPVISIIAKRQWLDWRELRHRNVQSTEVMETVEHFCAKICDTLTRTWHSPEEQRTAEEAERKRQAAEAEAARQVEEKRRHQEADQRAEEETRRTRNAAEARHIEGERHRQEAESKRLAQGAESRKRAQVALSEIAQEEHLRDEANAKQRLEQQRALTQKKFSGLTPTVFFITIVCCVVAVCCVVYLRTGGRWIDGPSPSGSFLKFDGTYQAVDAADGLNTEYFRLYRDGLVIRTVSLTSNKWIPTQSSFSLPSDGVITRTTASISSGHYQTSTWNAIRFSLNGSDCQGNAGSDYLNLEMTIPSLGRIAQIFHFVPWQSTH